MRLNSFYRRFSLACYALLLVLMPAFALAEDDISWPFRSGPTLNGHVGEADAAGLPSVFDEASGQNIKWKVKLDGLGHSTAIIGGGKAWLTSATEDGKQQFVYCIDAE